MLATIPGRFPVHERSNSAPGHSWHKSPRDALRSAMASSALSPIRSASPTKRSPAGPRPGSDGVNRASSILLPDDMGEFILPLLPQSRYNSIPRPEDSPSLASGHKNRLTDEVSDSPPPLPPKSPGLKLRLATQAAAMSAFDSSRAEVRQGGGSQTPVPITAPEGRVSPNPFSMQWQSPRKKRSEEVVSPLVTSNKTTLGHKRSASNTTNQIAPPTATLTRSNSFATLTRSRSNSNFSQYRSQSQAQHHREGSEGSVLDRGRPTKRVDGIIKRKLTVRNPTIENAFIHLPLGATANEAALNLPVDEVEALHHQAQGQAENFEVLKYKDVLSLSKVCGPANAQKLRTDRNRNYVPSTIDANICVKPMHLFVKDVEVCILV